MGAHYSNTTTKRLEGYARARGIHWAIVIDEANSQGRFFAVGDPRSGKAWSGWIALGWTAQDVRDRIDRQPEFDAVDADMDRVNTEYMDELARGRSMTLGEIEAVAHASH